MLVWPRQRINKKQYESMKAHEDSKIIAILYSMAVVIAKCLSY